MFGLSRDSCNYYKCRKLFQYDFLKLFALFKKDCIENYVHCKFINHKITAKIKIETLNPGTFSEECVNRADKYNIRSLNLKGCLRSIWLSASITKIEISLFDDENFLIFPDFFSRFPDNFLNDFLA